MAKFSDRIFGNNVHPDVINIFDNLQQGSFEVAPNEPIKPHRDYIGDRTTFARMWTASLISGSIVDEEGEPAGTTQKVIFNIINEKQYKKKTKWNGIHFPLGKNHRCIFSLGKLYTGAYFHI